MVNKICSNLAGGHVASQGTFEHWIDGRPVAAADGRTFLSLNPADGSVLAEVAHGGQADVDHAVAAARAALSGSWARCSAAAREGYMHALAELLKRDAEELAELECLDNGKPLALARLDVARAITHMRYFAGWPTKIEGEVMPVANTDMLVYTRKEPVGVCGQIVPWNFPLVMAVWKIAPVLATGCTAVLKPAEQTPLSALRLARLATEAGIPDGVINVVTGDGETGAALVDHPGVDKIAFTGSTAVGREIGARCGRALKRVTLELGGKSPNIILPDADLDAAVAGAFRGIYYNAGQACNAGSRLFVQERQYDEVVTRLAERAATTTVGPGNAPDTEVGPVISAEQRERVLRYIAAGRDEGAEVVVGGEAIEPVPGGYYVAPTLFTGVTDSMTIAREEIFGPVLVALPYEDLEEVAARANDTEFGLAAGVWTRDISNAHRLAGLLEAGNVYINCWGVGDPAAPFGGFKASGIGREKGHANLDGYLEVKTVYAQL
jgi:acyl-CoA reductase-like NAD-dependent aldehyde dehydrogenase